MDAKSHATNVHYGVDCGPFVLSETQWCIDTMQLRRTSENHLKRRLPWLDIIRSTMDTGPGMTGEAQVHKQLLASHYVDTSPTGREAFIFYLQLIAMAFPPYFILVK